MSEFKEICLHCYWWNIYEKNSDICVGGCCRYAPSSPKGQPITDALNWCGDYKKRIDYSKLKKFGAI